MTKFIEVLKSIALQSGVSETEIKSILDIPEIASLEVDDAVSTKLVAPRLTMEAAKNNPDLKKHFTAQALNGIDSEVARMATKFGLDAEAVKELQGLDSTSKRVNAIAEKVQALEAAKPGKGTVDTEKLNKQIEELNGQIAKIREEKTLELQAKDASLENERIDWTLNSMLSNHEYVAPVDKEINVSVAKALVSKAIQEKGLKIVRKDNALALLTAEGTEHFENNVKVSVSDFSTKVLANAKVLKASNSTPANTKTQTQTISDGNKIRNASQVLEQLSE